MEEALTLKEIANRLGTPESNLRYYRNRIGDFLPSVGKGRRRRYLPESMEIFRRTVEMVQEGVSLDRVYRNLAAERPIEADTAGAITQEALAEDLSKKIAEKIAISGLSKSDAESGAIQKQYMEELVGRLEEAVGRLGIRIEDAAGYGAGKSDEPYKTEIARLSVEIEEKRAELKELREDLRKKDAIIERQKEQLLEARSGRLNIEKELTEIRAILERASSGR
ncbi:MAG TPA: MerR family transcriptional regulator [bacterium]|nr:MerR family transcriptional regulator [bacterium]HPI76836.1 MerR family transcriptional regulator [bacterium]